MSCGGSWNVVLLSSSLRLLQLGGRLGRPGRRRHPAPAVAWPEARAVGVRHLAPCPVPRLCQRGRARGLSL